jgi:hypothetical protein
MEEVSPNRFICKRCGYVKDYNTAIPTLEEAEAIIAEAGLDFPAFSARLDRDIADTLRRFDHQAPMLTDVTRIRAEYEAWWLELTKKGDPSRRANLTREAFIAGWIARDSADA